MDVLQADATRCGGITGFLAAAALCAGPLPAHVRPLRPALHAHPCCAAGPVESVEYFHDHVRIESELFDGLPELRDGRAACRICPGPETGSSCGRRTDEGVCWPGAWPTPGGGRVQRLLCLVRRGQRAAAGRRDLPRALRGLVRQQVDVDAASWPRRRWSPRASPACPPSGRRAPCCRLASALYVANGVAGVVTHLRGIARKPGGLREPLYNLVMGPPLLAPGRWRWSARSASRPRLAGGSGDGRGRSAAPDHLPNRRDGAAARPAPAAAPAARGRRRRCTAATRTTTCWADAGHWDAVTRRRRARPRSSASRRSASSRPPRRVRWARSATSSSPRTPSRASRSWLWSTPSCTRAARRLPLRRDARRPRDLATGRPGPRRGRRARGAPRASPACRRTMQRELIAAVRRRRAGGRRLGRR